jgi:L-2-hydroxyglutarate oxidase
MRKYDIIIIGGGIVGVSTAWHLLERFPNHRILVLEKEHGFARHQTGHNSGVIHAGVYYQPGSLKATFCREGNRETFDFCKKHGISAERCGKMLVATSHKELTLMKDLHQRIQENQIEVHWLDKEQIREIEPHISGLAALFVPDTGIVDYRQVTARMADLFSRQGGEVFLGTEITGLMETMEGLEIMTSRGSFRARYLISCAGLMADRVTRMLGIKTDFQIIPFRGEYYRLPFARRNIIRHLIYPIPDPDLPFLGIHLTRMIDGMVTAGPNAVLGFKREGYRKTDISMFDVIEMMLFKGFWKVMRNHMASGFHEWINSMIKSAYLKQVRKYCPSIGLNDLQPYPAGVRAQAVSKSGNLIHDFLFVKTRRTIHVCNAPSPAATSAIPIGNYIVEKAASLFSL